MSHFADHQCPKCGSGRWQKFSREPDVVCQDCGAIHHQPGIAVGTEARVCEDIAKRQAHGINKYHITVEKNPLTLREWLNHAYEECLDQAIYLKRAIEEIDCQQGKSKSDSPSSI